MTMDIEQIDEQLTKIFRRKSLSIEEVKEMLGSLGVEYSWYCERMSHTRTEVQNMLLDLRSEHTETNTITKEVTQDGEAIQDELDALIGTDINVS
jgi:hypothetical protein